MVPVLRTVSIDGADHVYESVLAQVLAATNAWTQTTDPIAVQR